MRLAIGVASCSLDLAETGHSTWDSSGIARCRGIAGRLLRILPQPSVRGKLISTEGGEKQGCLELGVKARVSAERAAA
jgi:hypothetical protein